MGGFAVKGNAASYACAIFSSSPSDQKLPTNCTPIGRLSEDRPHGTLIAGTPDKLADTV